MYARRILRFGLAIMLVVVAVFLVRRLREGRPAVRHFEFTYVTRVPELPPDAQSLRLWIPLPPSNEQQTISNVTVDSPLPLERHREPQYGNKYLYLEAPRARLPHPLEVRLHFRTTRLEKRVAFDRGPGRVSAAEKPPAEVARFLQPNRLVPINGIIGGLAEQEARGRKKPLDKARAIYDYVVSTVRYDKTGEGWGRGDAIHACNVKRGNCTDFHALFIGMMRAAGIPARFEIGFPLPPDRSEGEIPGYHCWAQFYVEPYGWIPVDASEAWKHPEKREYFFGSHDQHRVLFTLGRDVRLNPAQAGDPLNYFIYPYAEVDGKPWEKLETRFNFRDLPVADE